ncbi:MAG TPA: sugar phosphate nucleotidyltransferase [Bacilli bacterium]
MKAVIMAGGKGSRMRPLTCQIPKPMVPLLNRPCLEYIIELLRNHGITEIAVTVQYLSEVIINYFGDGSKYGVKLHYFEEPLPLGTAGSVKNAESFLDEPFIVISGDGLTDFDLTKAIHYHKSKKSLVTLVLTPMNAPLEYGVVMTDSSGRIQRFMEKPSWSEVFSDTINTGIYILQPEVLQSFEKGITYDFSTDLFPLLLSLGEPLYGYVAEGYWSDIGNLHQYRQTQFDMLDKKVKVRIAAQEVLPGIYVEESVQLPSKVKCSSPVFIGPHCSIGYGAEIGEYSVIGRNTVLGNNVSLERSILWDGVFIGEGSEMFGTTVCNHSTIGEVSSLADGSIIGTRCNLGRKTVIRPNVKLWPGKYILPGSTVHTSIIWGEQTSGSLFGSLGILGIPNVEMTPEFASKLAAAYGTTLPTGSTIGVSSSSHKFAILMKTSFILGLHSAGIHTMEISSTMTAAVRPCISRLKLQGGIHFRIIQPFNEKRLLIEFMDHLGLPLTKGQERQIDHAYGQENYVRSDMEHTGANKNYDHSDEDYLSGLISDLNVEPIHQAKFEVILHYNQYHLERMVSPWLQRLNCKTQSLFSDELTLQELSDIVVNNHANFGVHLDGNGQNMTLFTDKGIVVPEDTLMTLKILVLLSLNKDTVVGIPVSAPEIIETLAASLPGRIVRTKETARAMMEVGVHQPFHLLFDDVYALSKIMEYLACEHLTLTEAIHKIPKFYILREEVPCPWEDKGRIMRLIMNETKDKPVELMDGIKIYNDEGWVLIMPDSEEPSFRIIAQSHTITSAENLVLSYSQRILNSFPQS